MQTDRTEPETTLKHRRRGVNFDTLGHVYRDVREFLFANGFRMTNRPGQNLGADNDPLSTGFVKVFSMVESYFQKAPSVEKGINAFILGRRGDGGMRNASLIELTARHVVEISNDLGQNNGAIKLRITREDEDPATDNTGVTVADAGTLGKDLEGNVVRVAGDGESGGVTIAWLSSKDQSPSAAPYRIQIRSDGIFMFGLPTADPGVAGAVYRSGVNLRISTG